jgi:small-conductance mechanosensitive channel
VIKDGERMDVPGPFVVFKDFGDSSLLFELRACISDIYSKLVVASELRFEIYRRFREQGIEMPFPQRDVWIRNPHEVGRPEPEAGVDGSADDAD